MSLSEGSGTKFVFLNCGRLTSSRERWPLAFGLSVVSSHGGPLSLNSPNLYPVSGGLTNIIAWGGGANGAHVAL